MGHGRLYRFECQACDGEYVAVGVETDADAVHLARANGWTGEDDLWYCPDCKWDGDPAAPDLDGIFAPGERDRAAPHLGEAVARRLADGAEGEGREIAARLPGKTP